MNSQTEALLKHPRALCNMVRRVAVEAGDHILQHFDESGAMAEFAERKPDGTPTTDADREAEEIIIAALADITPGIPVVAEEALAAGNKPDLNGHEWFWLVDPLDGTRYFAGGSPDFTVNIALIHNGVPVLGVVYLPVEGTLYAGCGDGTATRWNVDSDIEKPIRVREMPVSGVTVVTGANQTNRRAALDEFISSLKVSKVLHRGSSLKICMIASGKADVYPRFGTTSEWDTAAGDAVLRAAGGHIVDLQGRLLTYGHAGRDFRNPEFVASSGFWPFTPDA